MTPRLVLRPRPRLGSAFAAEVDRALGGIVEKPLAYPAVQDEIRRALVRRFPYAVDFRATPDEIVVLAVLHGRRHPRRWQLRR